MAFLEQRCSLTARFACWLVFSLCLALFPHGVAAQEPVAQVRLLLYDASRALQSGSAAAFLALVDRKSLPSFHELETNVVALTSQAELASSIAIVQLVEDGDGYTAEVDWVLQVKLRSGPAPIESRQENVRVRAGKAGKQWRMVALEPLSFFRAP